MRWLALSSRLGLGVKKHPVREDKILGTLYRLLVSNSPNLAVYVEFSPLRYPIVKILAMPILADVVEEGDSLYELLSSSVLEIILNIESLYRGRIDFEEDVLSMKLMCEHGWIVYEYTILKSEWGVPYVSKLWMHVVEGVLKHEAIDVDDEFSIHIREITDRIAVKAREILEYDGYL